MNRLSLVIFAVLVLSSFTKAQLIDLKLAEKAALVFFEERLEKDFDLVISSSYSHVNDGIILYHVINFSDNKFVIFSADRRLFPILAYSLTSVCPEDNQAPAFVWWMKRYENQILETIQQIDFSVSENGTLWNHLLGEKSSPGLFTPFRTIEPMLTTTWNQDKWYNEFCPIDDAGPGGRAYAGCVATAIGQVMNYYRHPLQGTGFYSYEHPEYGTIEVDFGEQTYNWDAMATSLSFSNIEIAKLLYHIGASVDMVYGPTGSGMYNHKGAYIMRTYFDYLDETRYYFRDSVDESFDWVDTLIMHLDNGMPLYYAGWSDTIYQSGHAFVCDGYQDTSFFHFNWGWGGSFDGFFNIQNLIPGGADFTLNHEMIAYSNPKTNYPHYCDGLNTLNTNRGAIDDGSGPLFDYAADSDCQWLIAPSDSVSSITLNFISFNLDESDMVLVYDGEDETGILLGAFTGTELPSSVTADGNRMFISFQSDGSVQGKGFLVEYVSEIPVFCTMTYQYYYDDFGTIGDGSEIYDYYNDAYCRWIIEPVGAFNFLITFTLLDTEEELDFLRIYDITNSVVVDTFSGNVLPEPFLVNSSNLKLTFRTSKTTRGDGWAFDYVTNVVGIDDNNEESLFAVYPNPVIDKLNILSSIEMREKKIRITDTQGRVVFVSEIQKDLEKIDLSFLSPGVYLIHFMYEKQNCVRKIIKE